MSNAPSQSTLDAFFVRATRARVKPVLGGGGILADVGEPDARALRDLVRIRDFDGDGFHCMCPGDLALELLDGESAIATITLHHGISIRLPGWSSDAMLVDGRAMLEWLANRGAPEWLERFEQSRDDAARGQDARRAWELAAPACLADLSRFESDDGMPLMATDPEIAEAEAVVRAAYPTPALAAADLLAWFGSSGGPYSGYPSYEELPEQILGRLGTKVALEATNGASDAVLRGAARFFSSWHMVSARKSDLADVDDALWERMRGHVPNVSDNLGRFDGAARISRETRARRANPAPVKTASGATGARSEATRERATEVGVGEQRLRGLASDGNNLYAADGNRLVAFAPGSTAPRVLHTFEDPFFEFTYLLQMLIVTQVNQGTVGKVLMDGKHVVMAQGRGRPMMPATAPAVMAWMEQPQIVDPVTRFAKQESYVCRFSGGADRVRHAPEGAWGLVVDTTWLFWIEKQGNENILMRTGAVHAHAPEMLAKLPDRLSILALGQDDVIVAYERTIAKVSKSGGSLAPIATTSQPIAAIAVDDSDLFAITEDDDRNHGHVEHVKLGTGTTTRLLTYPRPPWDRPAIVAGGRAIAWTSNDRILSLPRV